MNPDVQTYGTLGAAFIAVATVVVTYLNNREKTKALEEKVQDATARATEARQAAEDAKRDMDKCRLQLAEWERKEAICQQSLLDADRRLSEKERQTLGVMIELRDMQTRVIELQKELEKRPKPRRSA